MNVVEFWDNRILSDCMLSTKTGIFYLCVAYYILHGNIFFINIWNV